MGIVSDDGLHDALPVPVMADGVVSGWEMECLSCDADQVVRTWRGLPPYTRVTEPDQHDLMARRIYVPDDKIDSAWWLEPEIYNHLHAELDRVYWRPLHDGPPRNYLTEITTIRARLDTETRRLDATVAAARATGVSWAAIGRAAAMSRQAAQKRWRGRP